MFIKFKVWIKPDPNLGDLSEFKFDIEIAHAFTISTKKNHAPSGERAKAACDNDLCPFLLTSLKYIIECDMHMYIFQESSLGTWYSR